MTTWQRNRAIHSGADDARPDERIASVIGDDRFCDACDGKRAHTRECPVYLEIQRRSAEDRAKLDRNWKAYEAETRRVRLMSTKKGRASL